MKTHYILQALMLLSVKVSAQVVGGVQAKGLDMQTNPSGFVTQLPMAPPETRGDVYLESGWSNAIIGLSNKQELKNVPIKLNLKTNTIEISQNNQIKALSPKAVEYFTWTNVTTSKSEKFIPSHKLNNLKTPLEGFLKIAADGEWLLLIKTNLVLIKSNYVPALDAGVRDNSIVKREEFYLVNNDKLFTTDLSKKKFSEQFDQPLREKLQSFMKENNISNKKIEGLLSIHDFLIKK